MKTALEILKENCKYFGLGITEREAISAMKEYAKQALSEASNKAKTIKMGNSGSFYDAAVDRESILNIKEQLK